MSTQHVTMDKPKAEAAASSTPVPTKPVARTSVPARSGAFAQMGWEPIRRMRDELDRIFEQTFGGWPVLFEGPSVSDRWGFDLQEKDDALIIRAEAPGFETDDFDVQVRGDHLMLRAYHKVESKEEGGVQERSRRELYRSVPLPSGIDAARVEAEYHNGILTITLPKSAECQARRIAVKG